MKALRLVWLLVLLAGALWLTQSGLKARIDSNLLALLPSAHEDALHARAQAQLVSDRQLVLAVGSRSQSAAEQGATRLAQALALAPLSPASAAFDLNQVARFVRDYRGVLLAESDRSALAQPGYDWAARASSLAYSPFGGLLPWQDDPFGTLSNWLEQQSRLSPVEFDGQFGWVEDGSTHWAILPYTLKGSAFSPELQHALDAALARYQPPADTTLLRAGVVFHASAASMQAQFEVSTIGLGSLIGIVTLVLLTFRGVHPLLLVVLSVGSGVLLGLTTTLLVFDRIHLITLVFGASVIGVAVDFSLLLHARALAATDSAAERLRALLPGLISAGVTTLAAYLLLTAAPLPGLKQMGVFAASGLLAAWLTEVLFYPVLAGKALSAGPLGRWLLAVLPRIRLTRAGLVCALAGVVLALIAFSRIQTHDDVRTLISADAALVAEQTQLARILLMPSPAQYFLVSGSSADEALARAAALTRKLDGEVRQGRILAYRSLSQWLPDAATQARNAEHLARLNDAALLARINTQLGSALAPAPPRPLTPDAFAASPLAQLAGPLWLGQAGGRYGTVVMVSGVSRDTTHLAALQGPGVEWVDRTAQISALLDQYRNQLLWLLLAAYGVSMVLLLVTEGRKMPRMLAPVLLGSMAALAVLALSGQPLGLMSVLALTLLLGMGLDYSIYVQRTPDDARIVLAVTLAAVSTLLAFGLLALSRTPALSIFGVTLATGIAVSWLCALLFKPGTRS
ncbi:MMPL family transporter [Chitinibacteraceae bacterium HSL-7]